MEVHYFTKHEFVMEIIEGWKRFRPLGAVMAIAAKIPQGERIDADNWMLLRKHINGMFPGAQSAMMCQDIRGFVAGRFPNASKALWDGKPNLAHALIMKSKGETPYVIRRSDNMPKLSNKGIVYIHARELDKKSDWNVCK